MSNNILNMKKKLYYYLVRIKSNKSLIEYNTARKIYMDIYDLKDELSINNYLKTIVDFSNKYKKEYEDLYSKYNKETNKEAKSKILISLNECYSILNAYKESYNIISKYLKNKNQTDNNSFNNEDTTISDKIIELLEKYNKLDKNTTEAKKIQIEVYKIRTEREEKFKKLYRKKYRVFISEIESLENIAAFSLNEPLKNRMLNGDEYVLELRDCINAINEYYFIDELKIKKYYRNDNDKSDGFNQNKYFKRYNYYLRKFNCLINSLFNKSSVDIDINGQIINTNDLISYLGTCNLDGDYSTYISKFKDNKIGGQEPNRKLYNDSLSFLNNCINSLCDKASKKIGNKKVNIIDRFDLKKDYINKRNKKLNEIYLLKEMGRLDSKEEGYERK